MDEYENNFTRIQKEHQKNIRDKLIKFTSSEISFFNAPFPAFDDFNEKIIQQRSDFIDQFLNYSPYFNPKFFSDRIKEKFSKKFIVQDKLSLINYLKNKVDHAKWRSNKVYNRINKPETYPLFSNYYPQYLDSISKYSEEYCLAIQSLESEIPDSRYIESILKYDFYHHFCHFQIDNLLYIFKRFALIRRKEILSIVKESLIKDIVFDLNPASIPTIITQFDDLIEELKRFSTFLNIEFDIDSQDGQHFSYSCEKLFFKTINQNIQFDCTDKTIPMIEYPSFLDLLNNKFIKDTQIDENITFSFDNLVNPSEDGMEQILKKFNTALIRELTKDKVTAYVRLQFCKNKMILNSIINSIKSIEKVSKSILKEELKDFFTEHFLIFRKITLVVASSVKSNSSNRYSIDNDSLLEIILDLYDQFYKYKVKVLNSLQEIDINSENVDISSITKKFIEFRPDLVGGDHKSCIQPFQLSVNILKQISSALQSLINLQIYTQKEFSSLYSHHFPFFEFPFIDPKYQLTNDSFPFSPFEVFPYLKKVSEFMHVSREVVLEITETFSVRSARYKPYFEYAIWTQLLNEMRNFLTNMTPESIFFNMKVSEKVASTMTSPHLNDLNFILNIINDYKGRNKVKFVTNFRNMILLGWKLQSSLVKTDICMKMYNEQLRKFEPNREMTIDFAYGDYEFAAISNDWTSDELEKITNAQHCYQVALEIAVRFNNYRHDIDCIQKVLEMNQYEIQLPNKAKQDQINIHKVIKMLPSLLFYEPNLIDINLFANIGFCYITAAKDFTDSNYLINFYLPYSIRSEIAFICILERCLLHSYSDYEVFHTSTNPKQTFLDSQNKLDHFFLPTIPQSLFLDRGKEILYNVLRFVSIRYQLLKYNQHAGYISRIKNNDLKDIFREKLLWSSTLFSRIKYEINDCLQCNDIEFSADYFGKEREIFCSKQILVVVSVLDSLARPKIDENKKKSNDDQIETFSFESVQSCLIDMNRPILGSSSFMDSSLYAQTYLDQFWYQCNDSLRIEFSHSQSQIEKQVSDSIVGAKPDKYMDAIYEYSIESTRFAFMRFGLFYLDFIKDSKKVTIDSIIKNITKEIIENGIKKFDAANQMQATYKTNMKSKSGTIEANFLKAKMKAMTEEIGNMVENLQIDFYKDQFLKEDELVESIFHKPTTILKPECYSERIPMKSSQQIFIPPIPSLQNQFSEETNYAKLLFCRLLCNCILKNKKIIDDETFSINENEFKESLNDLSSILSIFFNESRSRFVNTWKGYLQNLLFNLKLSSDMHESMNIFVEYFINRFNNSVYTSLADKLKDNYLKISHLRDRENVINQEQEQFTEQESKEIRKEFELLVHDLNEEIKKAKNRFVVAKNKFFDASFNAINKIKDDPNYLEKCVKPPLTNEPPKIVQIEKSKIKKTDDETKNDLSLSNLNIENKSDSTETDVDSSESEIKEGHEESKTPNVSFAPEVNNEKEEELKTPNVSFAPEVNNEKEEEELKKSNASFDHETNEAFDKSKTKTVSFIMNENENENEETEAFPSFSASTNIHPSTASAMIVSSPERVNTIMLTSTDKAAVMSQLPDESELFQQEQKSTENPQQNEQHEEDHHHLQQQQKMENEEEDLDQTELLETLDTTEIIDLHDNPEPSEIHEKKPTSTPPPNENINKARRPILRKSSSNNPRATNDLSKTTSNVRLSGRRSINLRKFQAHKMKKKQHRTNTTSTDVSNTAPEVSELSSSFSNIFTHDSIQFLIKKQQKPKEKPREMIMSVTERIEITKKSIEELQNLRKKLRISTTISAIAVKRIYSRMIAKVAEERKNYSAQLWRGRRILEEDLKEQNEELKEGYEQLSKADSEIELLQEEIGKTKEENIKLLHWKMFNIRQVEMIHKELRKINNNSDVNVSKLLRKINQKQEELEYLLIQQQRFEEDLYYQVTEPMMEADRVKRTLKIRRGQIVEENFLRQQQNQGNTATDESLNQGSESSSGYLGTTATETSFGLALSNLPLSEQINKTISNYKEQNEDMKIENDELRNKIKELEKQISELPSSRKKLIDELCQPDIKSARPKSHKTVFKPGKSKSARNNTRPGTSRNYY